jgi:hypothetical protein
MPSRTPLSAVPSHSSSVYSADDVSETNTTGTQIRHKSALSAAVQDNEHGRTEQSPITTGQPSQDNVGDQLMFGADEIGPRPPTPPRRRPRVTSTGSISLGTDRNTIDSVSSGDPLSLLLNRGLQHTSIDIPTSDQIKGSNAVLPKYTISEDVTVTVSPSDPPVDLDGSAPAVNEISQVDSQRNENRAIALEALSGRVKTITVGTLKSDNLVSATGRLYGLGDRSAGYYNGHFVTDLQRSSPPNKEQKKRSKKRFFCF